MAEVNLEIGGKTFSIVCADGEEGNLRAAAARLDEEARLVVSQVGRVPEARMLLMAGLMLADRIVTSEARGSASALAVPQRVEVPVVPEDLRKSLDEIATRSEALAERAEQRLNAAPDRGD